MSNPSFVTVRPGTAPATVFAAMSNSEDLLPNRDLLSTGQLKALDRLPLHTGDLPAWSDEVGTAAAAACRECGSFRLKVLVRSAGISLIFNVTPSTTIGALATFGDTLDALASDRDDVLVLIDYMPED